MEPCTMSRKFLKQDVIENFYSCIWTERYYGDSEVELTVPLTLSMAQKLREGTFICIDESNEPMIIETVNIEDGKIKVMGISILSWLNNRFIRKSLDHRKTKWKLGGLKAGDALGTIVKQMCTDKSTVLGHNKMGVGSVARENELIIPGLKLGAQDQSGSKIKKILVNYGPVYDELRRIAEQYKIGMQIFLFSADQNSYELRFRTYKGINRTVKETKHPVRFSVDMDSFADLKELRSVAKLTTLVYSYASSLEKIDTADNNTNPDTWLQQDNKPGVWRREKKEGKYTGFDLRAKLLLAGDIQIKNDLDEEDKNGPEDTVPKKRAELLDVLDNRAQKEGSAGKYISTVDGTVSKTNLFQYGIDYNLGDIVEVEGLTGVIEYSRVTEYIRTHDAEGERAYPTVEAVEP